MASSGDNGHTGSRTSSYLAAVQSAMSDPPMGGALAEKIAVLEITHPLEIRKALTPPTSVCLDPNVPPKLVAMLLRQLHPRDSLTVVLTAKKMFGQPVANEIISALSDRITFSVAGQMEIALHEALANAVMHGCLEVGDLRPTDPDQIIVFQQRIDAALSDPAKATRPILTHVHWTSEDIEIQVRDVGPGHQPTKLAGGVYAGRGISIITTLCQEIRLSQHGRRVDMVFDRSQSNASH